MTVRNAKSPLRVAVAGASGTVGRGIVLAIRDCDDIRVGAVITRDPESDAIRALRPFLPAEVLVSTCMDDAVASVTDALIDYTHPSSAPRNVLDAVRRRKAVVIGTSGLTDKLLGEIALEAEAFGVGVVAASNFSLTAILMRKAVLDVARYLGSVEIIEYANPKKADAPSATALDIAHALGSARRNDAGPDRRTDAGLNPARGAAVAEIPVHALRLDSYYHSIEVIFGEKAERLTLRHDAINGVEPYARGTLLALRAALSFKGLKCGLDEVLSLDDLV